MCVCVCVCWYLVTNKLYLDWALKGVLEFAGASSVTSSSQHLDWCDVFLSGCNV